MGSDKGDHGSLTEKIFEQKRNVARHAIHREQHFRQREQQYKGSEEQPGGQCSWSSMSKVVSEDGQRSGGQQALQSLLHHLII